MFVDNNKIGITIDQRCIESLKKNSKELLNIFLKIYESLIYKDIQTLNKIIPNIQMNQIINNSCLKEKWIEAIENEEIRYYKVDVIEVKTDNNRIELTSKIRAKFYEYNGCWIVDSYIIFEKVNNEFVIKEILI